jgi:hypothetical protein
MESGARMQGGKCTFGYYSASGKFHAVMWAKRGPDEHHAYFDLQGTRIYLFQVPSPEVAAQWRRGRREVVFLHLSNGAAGVPGEPLRLHVVKPASGMFAYTHCWQPYYSSTQSWMPFLRGQDCVHLWYFTATATVLYAQSRFRGAGVGGTAFPFGLDERVLHKMVDYDEDTLLDQFGRAHDRISSIHRGLLQIASTHIQTIQNMGGQKVEIANFLTAQLRRRHLRVARKLLYTKLQEAQERIAQDPVKRCAACAIESVKSQLALGDVVASGDDDAKRQRVE